MHGSATRFTADADGIVTLDRVDDLTVRDHVARFLNEVSPGLKGVAAQPREGAAWLDTFHGQAFEGVDNPCVGVYGVTEALPAARIDALANDGFLRIPYRRIPRRRVDSRGEIEMLLAAAEMECRRAGLKLLLRGQTTEYLLRRSPRATRLLYGCDEVLEPSLQPSSSRAQVPLEAVLPEWCALLNLFVEEQVRGTSPSRAAEAVTLAREWAALRASEHFLLFALSLAQHYGLPSSGLDATERLDVALFFALRDDVRGQGRVVRATPTQSRTAVLYLVAQSELGWMDYDVFRPHSFPLVRPLAQGAKFLHLGWGCQRNAPARQLLAALYLDPRRDWGAIPAAARVYPPPERDAFGRFLSSQLDAGLPPRIRAVVDLFHWVVE